MLEKTRTQLLIPIKVVGKTLQPIPLAVPPRRKYTRKGKEPVIVGEESEGPRVKEQQRPVAGRGRGHRAHSSTRGRGRRGRGIGRLPMQSVNLATPSPEPVALDETQFTPPSTRA